MLRRAFTEEEDFRGSQRSSGGKRIVAVFDRDIGFNMDRVVAFLAGEQEAGEI